MTPPRRFPFGQAPGDASPAAPHVGLGKPRAEQTASPADEPPAPALPFRALVLPPPPEPASLVPPPPPRTPKRLRPSVLKAVVLVLLAHNVAVLLYLLAHRARGN